MLARPAPRPAAYRIESIAQALADRDVDLTEAEDCRFAMLEAFGVVPDVDWPLACTLARFYRHQAGGMA